MMRLKPSEEDFRDMLVTGVKGVTGVNKLTITITIIIRLKVCNR